MRKNAAEDLRVLDAGDNLERFHLSIDRSRVSLQISDDGRGLGPSAASTTGMGMQTMKDRAAAVGGRLSVSANHLGGTSIACQCPNRSQSTLSA
jgi:signal transduction histidine kinase